MRRKDTAAEKRRHVGKMARRESVAKRTRARWSGDGGEGWVTFLESSGEKLLTQEMQMVFDREHVGLVVQMLHRGCSVTTRHDSETVILHHWKFPHMRRFEICRVDFHSGYEILLVV